MAPPVCAAVQACLRILRAQLALALTLVLALVASLSLDLSLGLSLSLNSEVAADAEGGRQRGAGGQRPDPHAACRPSSSSSLLSSLEWSDIQVYEP